MSGRGPCKIGDELIAPGEHRIVDLPVANLAIHTPVGLPVHVIHGRQDGPTLFVLAAIHGDEVIGVEIIRRLLRTRTVKRLKGTLLCVPIVNAFGFINHSRYLPDRRDLNRTFPGNPQGSLAAQLAHLLMSEIIQKSDFGIDLHSAALNRINLPQLRSTLKSARTRELAQCFGAPIIMRSADREGSLRQSAEAVGVEVLVYEAGEALRFDEVAIRVGVQGILRIMKALAMIPPSAIADPKVQPAISQSSEWMRAPEGGILRTFRTIGDSVEAEEVIGVVSNPYEPHDTEIRTSSAGLIIGRTNMPVVNLGDALFHIAKFERAEAAEKIVGEVEEEVGEALIFDEDEII